MRPADDSLWQSACARELFALLIVLTADMEARMGSFGTADAVAAACDLAVSRIEERLARQGHPRARALRPWVIERLSEGVSAPLDREVYHASYGD